MSDEYTCYSCDSIDNTPSVIIIFSGWSAYIFNIQVKCFNSQLVEASDVGDVGFLTNVLLVPQLTGKVFSEGGGGYLYSDGHL